ncbi:MAG: type II toxin-antitoxin system RelE/ParE family toxin [Myxococcota bacterium]
MKVRFLEPARDEFLRSVDFYEDKAPGLGAALTEEVERVVANLSQTPALGVPYVESTRRFPLSRFPYSIVYSIEENSILVIALAHQRRRPGYWTGRLETDD